LNFSLIVQLVDDISNSLWGLGIGDWGLGILTVIVCKIKFKIKNFAAKDDR